MPQHPCLRLAPPTQVLKGARAVPTEAGIALADASQELGGAPGLTVMNFGGDEAAAQVRGSGAHAWTQSQLVMV